MLRTLPGHCVWRHGPLPVSFRPLQDSGQRVAQYTPLARLARVGAAWCLPPTFLGTNGYSQLNTAAGPAGQQRSDGGFAMCATLCIRGQRSFTRAACLPVRPSGLSHLAGAASTLCTGRTLQAHHRATPPRASFWTIRTGSATLLWSSAVFCGSTYWKRKGSSLCVTGFPSRQIHTLLQRAATVTNI